MNQLPKSWSWVSIVELLDKNSNGKPFQQGWSPQCHNHPASENCWGVLKTTAIQDGEFWGHENKELPESIEPRPHLEVVKGDILMTCAGPRNRCGVVCFVKKTRSKLLMSGKMYRFRPNSTLLDSKYLEGFIRSHQAQRAIDSMKTGISDSGLNLTHGRFSELMVPLAPLSEQKRIVAKIEELFSELDSGIASLKTAQEQLKIYRQALLKHAFEGKLTEQWRKDNADKLETPEQLLACIQTERETRYQQQLNDWKQAVKDWEVKGKKGKKPQNPIKPKTHKKLSSDEVIQLGGLPHDWCWIRIGDISTVGTGVTPLRSNSLFYGNGDIPWVTSGALNQAFITKPSDLVTTKAFNETSLRLYPKNTLVVALYGEGKTRGKCSELLIEATTNQAIAAIVLEGKSAGLRRFLKWFLTKNYEEMRLTASGGVQPNLNLGIIERMAIPLCTIAEAEELSSILDEKFSQIDKVDAEITEQLRKTEVLRQSILKKAFSGQLVPQDPNDEPASELHGRVKAGK